MSASVSEQNQQSAGALLKQLREQQTLSVEDIAGKLHLEPRIIAALEANHFAIVPAATYARGYLRSYAKLLGADVEKIIALYNDDAAALAAPEIIPEIKHSTQASSADKPVKAFTYLLSLALVLLIVAWWQSDFIIETPIDLINDAGDVNVPPAMEENKQVEELRGASTETANAEPANEAQSEEAIDPIAADAVEENIDEATERVLITEELIADDSSADVSPDSNLTIESEAAEPYQDLIESYGEGPDEITITLNADSWVEVFEAGGDRLYLDLARNGQTLILNGSAPFSILLGFSEGAVITFNGEQIDHAPYARAGIARFSVGSEGSNIRE